LEAARIALASAAASDAALKPASRHATFFVTDMLKLSDRFEARSLDLALCLGNTLPHLSGGGAAAFLAQARGLLSPGGSLVLQTLNFSLPRIAPALVFPEISAAGAVMRRSYDSPAADSKEACASSSNWSRAGRSRPGRPSFKPLGPREVGKLLFEAGFTAVERFAGWDGRPFDEGRRRSPAARNFLLHWNCRRFYDQFGAASMQRGSAKDLEGRGSRVCGVALFHGCRTDPRRREGVKFAKALCNTEQDRGCRKKAIALDPGL